MKQAILDNVIDWENSTLPAKDTLTVDNFTMEYYGSNTLAGDIDGGMKQWAPIEGGTVTFLTYARMGAGEQKIRITYKGNAQYRPLAQTESTVTVNKAKVKVKSTSIYADSVRVSFATPNRAGLYTVTAVTDSKNYETGVGIGTLLVKMRSKGVKLNWNERFVNGKITAEEAKNFDFKAALSADGDVTIAQDSVHYLYSGFTSKWKIYSSTTTPPTEPGSYVMTVVTFGGNYQAAPITRGFKITK